MVLTIGLRGMFDLCTFGNSYRLEGRGFVGFNVDLILVAFSTKILMFSTIVLYK